MTIHELTPTDKSIVLGCFDQKTYFIIEDLGFCDYSDFTNWLEVSDKPTIIHEVAAACEVADKIVFVLDGILFPIDVYKSITCNELLLICKNDEFFNKTIFVRGENVINFDRNLVL